jgi:aryl-alcohol dehydrogenase-like predicted oxidoreductase
MAYNVLAGGILTGKYFSGSPPSVDNPDRASAEVTLGSPRGRMDTVGWGATLYRYRSQPALAAAREYAALAKRFGLSLTELSLRWSRERRAVTTSLIGTTSMSQLDEDLSYFSKKEPLPKELLWEIDRVHMKNRLPIFSSTDVGADWGGEGEIGERIP